MPNSSNGLTRRGVLQTGGRLLAGFALTLAATPAPARSVVDIRMCSADNGGHVWFDPLGLFVEPGTTVRWIIASDVHTTTAYHPANDGHSLRIPVGAEPWDSAYLVNPGDAYAVTFSVEGVYDYFCAPHEIAGMVGRIIVGQPTGPGALPFDYFKSDPAAASWQAVPAAARAAFPSIPEIMRRRRVSPPGMVCA